MRNLRTVLIIFAMIIASYILQSSVLHIHSAVIDFSPNVLLVTVCSLSMLFGEKKGILLGFFSGFLLDIFSGSALGMFAFIMSLMGYITGKFSSFVFSDDLKFPIAAILCSDLFYGTVTYIFLFLIRGRLFFGYYLIHVIIPEAAATTVVSLLVYPFIHRLYLRFLRPIRESEKNFAPGSQNN